MHVIIFLLHFAPLISYSLLAIKLLFFIKLSTISKLGFFFFIDYDDYIKDKLK